MDQAEKLRTLVNEQRNIAPELPKNMRVIAVTSGKGGVGKTNFTLNLAIFLSRASKRVIIIDADFGLANVELLLGVSPRYSLKEVLSGEVSMADALTTGPEGVRFLSGGSGLSQLADITESQLSIIIRGFNQLEEIADIMLIDTGAGISRSVTNLLKAAHEAIVVTTSDPTAIADAYAIVKAMCEDNTEPPELKIVVNRVESIQEGLESFERLQRVCGRFLKLTPTNLGSVPYDRNLVRAVKSQEPVVLLYPASESTKSIEAISRRLLDEPELKTTGVRRFMDRWMRYIKGYQ